jgi:hypothetical protein
LRVVEMESVLGRLRIRDGNEQQPGEPVLGEPDLELVGFIADDYPPQGVAPPSPERARIVRIDNYLLPLKAHGGDDRTVEGARRLTATLDKVEWNNSTLLEGDVAEAVAALKDEDGPEIQVHGSGNLIQTLMRHDLVDELRLIIFPLVLGTGKRLFSYVGPRRGCV